MQTHMRVAFFRLRKKTDEPSRLGSRVGPLRQLLGGSMRSIVPGYDHNERHSGQGGGESRNDRVARSGHVRHLVGAVNRNIRRLVLAFKRHHAIAPTRNQQRLQFHARHQLLAGGNQFVPVLDHYYATP